MADLTGDGDEIPPPPPAAAPGSPTLGPQRVAGACALVVLAVLLLTLVPADYGPAAATTATPVPVAPQVAEPPIATPQSAPPPPAASSVSRTTPLPPAATAGTPARSVPAVVATVLLVGLPRGTRVSVDGHARRGDVIDVPPGRRVLLATLTGFQPVADTIRLRRGDTLRWNPKLVAQVAARAPRAVSVPSSATRPTVHADTTCQHSFDAQQWNAAFTACSRLASAGNLIARRDLAALYQHGHGVHHDDALAVQWYQQAAQGNDGESMYQLGDAYEHGHGVDKNQQAAVTWYTRAADRGSAAAQYTLGEAYEKGHLGLAKDHGQALAWYRKASAQHYRDADSKVRSLFR